MGLLELILASIFYAVGGLFMKLSDGLSRSWPAAGVYSFFIAGATLQTIGMRHSDLGVSYIIVLGLEAVVTLLISILYLHETASPSRIAAVALIVLGIAWLRHT